MGERIRSQLVMGLIEAAEFSILGDRGCSQFLRELATKEEFSQRGFNWPEDDFPIDLVLLGTG
jgi:hypothetical protein